jgi:hypothetical protein
MSAIDGQGAHTPALACDLTAIDATQREAHQVLGRHLVNELAQETQELPDGYAFHFAAELYPEVVQFVANERLCCPFFRFAIEVTPGRGPIWLRITGPDEAVRMLGAELRGES